MKLGRGRGCQVLFGLRVQETTSTSTRPVKRAPTILHVGAFQDHQAGYIRRASRSCRRLRHPILCRVWQGIHLIALRPKALGLQLGLRHLARRRCSIANALRVSTSQMILSISAPSSVRLMRRRVDSTITTSP